MGEHFFLIWRTDTDEPIAYRTDGRAERDQLAYRTMNQAYVDMEKMIDSIRPQYQEITEHNVEVAVAYTTEDDNE